MPSPKRRFDIVVLNHERLHLFFGSWGKILNFDPAQDRLTVVSCSPSEAEIELVSAFEREYGVPVRYLDRQNRGIDQLARAEYFVGSVGSLEENLAYDLIFQMQDHYLDTEAPASRWGAEYDFGVKGDVVPDGIVFDLDEMERLANQHELDGFFCDRNNPCFISVEGLRAVAPCGGNFVIRSRDVLLAQAQEACRRLVANCDDTYPWAVYAEFMWGLIFFREGKRFYDLKRRRVYERWEPRDFYHAPDDFHALKRLYEAPAVEREVRRFAMRARTALALARRALRGSRTGGAKVTRERTVR
jgi:hypothetical protein